MTIPVDEKKETIFDCPDVVVVVVSIYSSSEARDISIVVFKTEDIEMLEEFEESISLSNGYKP